MNLLKFFEELREDKIPKQNSILRIGDLSYILIILKDILITIDDKLTHYNFPNGNNRITYSSTFKQR